MDRIEYDIKPISVNGRIVSRVVIDKHVRKHLDISDDLILRLVAKLDGTEQLPDDTKVAFEYFWTLVQLDRKRYRVVWLLEKSEIYIGIITVYRDDRRK